jgi:hypothetical protein
LTSIFCGASHINTEVLPGTAAGVADAAVWLAHTCLAVQMGWALTLNRLGDGGIV